MLLEDHFYRPLWLQEFLSEVKMIEKKSFQGGFTRGAGCQAGWGPASLIGNWEKVENWADVSSFVHCSWLKRLSCLIFSNYFDESWSAAKIDRREFSVSSCGSRWEIGENIFDKNWFVAFLRSDKFGQNVQEEYFIKEKGSKTINC